MKKTTKKKHKNILKDFDKEKSKHLERLATSMLKKDEINQKLKTKDISTDFLDNF